MYPYGCIIFLSALITSNSLDGTFSSNSNTILKGITKPDSPYPDTSNLMENTSSNFTSSNTTHWFQFDIPHCFNLNIPPNHIIFHTANAFLFLAYLAPFGIHGLLYLRTCLLLGSVFFALWAWLIICALDIFIWNAIFTLVNLLHVAVILYVMRPIRFCLEIEDVYRELFKPLKVSRRQFLKVIKCMREIKHLKPREPYCVESVTKVDRLSLVLCGRLVVSQHGHALHIVDSKQFLDSPEWFGVCTNDTYQVSITALEECKVMAWHRDKLKLSISADPFLQAVLDNVLGKDVVKKLLLVSENSCNGVNFYVCDDVVAETTKLLSKNKQGKTGLGVLLTRQVKNRDTNVWNLAKKGEVADAETSV